MRSKLTHLLTLHAIAITATATVSDSSICPIANDQTPAERCPDFDADCALVKDHFKCWQGGNILCQNGETVYIDQADGYCPYVLGLLPSYRK
jgi:hypothetical protein